MKIKGWSVREIFIVCVFILPPFSGLLARDDQSSWANYYRATQLYLENGSPKEIVTLCKNAYKHTKNPVLYCRTSFLLAQIYSGQQQFEEVHRMFREIFQSDLNISPTLIAETQLREGQIFLLEGKIDKAVAAFSRAALNDSNLFAQQEAQAALAWHAANQDRWVLCDSLLLQIEEENPIYKSDERLITLHARKAIAQNEPETAIELLKGIQNKTGLKYLAQAYESAGKQIMAVGIYKKIRDRFPNSSEAEDALFQASQVFMRAGDWLAAGAEFKRLLQYFPQSKYTDSIHFQLGWIYLNLDDLDNALVEFGFYSSTEYANYFKFMEAECLRRIGANDPEKMQQAIRLFHNLASLDLRSPIAPLAKFKVALTELEKGDTTSAIVSLRQFLNLYPKDELISSVNFLLAVNDKRGRSKKYFDNIVQSNTSGEILDAAYFSLQNQDFRNADYQQVITRSAIFAIEDSSAALNYWQRANHLLLAEAAYFLKHYDLASKEYDIVSFGKNDDLAENAALGNAWCSFQTEGLDSAAQMFRRLQSKFLGINRSLADYGYATVLFLQGKYEDALKEYPITLNMDNNPESASLVAKSLYRSAQCYYRLQYYSQAIETWEKLVHNYPKSELAADATFHVADTYFRANHFSDADLGFRYVMEHYPKSQCAAECGLRLAQSAYNAGNYQDAVERYQAFLNNYPQHEKCKDAVNGIQLSYYQLGQTEEATAALQKVVEQSNNPDLAADARYRIAMNYLQKNKYQEATEAFKEILTLFPNSSYAIDAQFALAKSFMFQENYPAATREFLKFIQYFPKSTQISEAYYLLGVGYFNLESYSSAIDYFEKITNHFPKSEFYASALQNLGCCYERLNEKTKALECFEKYNNEFPNAEDRFKIYLQVAILLDDLELKQKAIAIFADLRNCDDKNVAAEAAFRMGLIYVAQNEKKKASKAFQIAIKNGEKENYYRLSAIAQLAAIYENNGQRQKAISAYELLVNSTNEDRWVIAAKERIDALAPKYSVKNE